MLRGWKYVVCILFIKEKIVLIKQKYIGTYCVLVACETAKSGVEPSECLELAKHVKQECPNLRFSGFMTIGMLDYTSTPTNFKVLTLGMRSIVGYFIQSSLF